MNSVKVLSVLMVSLFSLNVFAITDREVLVKAAKSVEDAVILSTTVGEDCRGNYLDIDKFSDLLRRNNRAIVIESQGRGGSAEGSGSMSETFEGAIVVPAKEAYSSSPNTFDGENVSQVFGLELLIERRDCTSTKTVGKISVYGSKSNKKSIVLDFVIQK